jgi:hypothetical protein
LKGRLDFGGPGSGFRVWESGFGVQGVGFRVWGSGFGVQGLGLRWSRTRPPSRRTSPVRGGGRVWGFGAKRSGF